jgi:hypothetical protein
MFRSATVNPTTGCITDWVPLTASNTSQCPNAVLPRNGTLINVNLLGPGTARPFALGIWHDFIVHFVYKATTNGVLQVWHRVESGVWELLYSNVPGDNALIQVTPHPTTQWNMRWGAPGEDGLPGEMYFQFYRAKPHPTEHLYHAGIRRRQSFTAIRAEFP